MKKITNDDKEFLKIKICEYLEERDTTGASFIQLGEYINNLGFDIDGIRVENGQTITTDYPIKEGHNLICWTGWNTIMYEILNELQEEKIFLKGTTHMIYIMDGGWLNVPIAKSMKRKYKNTHWVPTLIFSKDVQEEVLHTGEK